MFSAVPRQWLAPAVLGGALLGLIYTLSPLTVWTAVGAVLLVRLSARGLPEREYRWFVGLLVAAFALRVLAVGALFLVSAHDTQAAGTIFGDESYSLFRSWRMRDALLGVPMIKYDYLIASETYGTSNYLTFITFVQLLFGPAPYGLRLVNALAFIGAMLLLFRIMRRSFGPTVAFAGLILLLFLPTLFFWSISLLKEPFYFVLTVVVLAAALELAHARNRTRQLALVAAGAAALAVLHDLRVGAVTLAAAGLVLGFCGRWLVSSPRRLAFGAGLVFAGVLALAVSPAVQGRVLANIDSAATEHTGHVFTVGHAYKLLDESYYVFPDKPNYALTGGEAARFVVRALASYLVVPLPWQIATTGELAYLPEQIVWYLLLALGLVGLVAGYRRDPLVTCLLVGYLVPTAIVVALTTGNVGTLVRHRTLIVPYLVWLSAIGWGQVAGRLSRERATT